MVVVISNSAIGQNNVSLPKILLSGQEVYDTLNSQELAFFKDTLARMSFSDLKKYRESYIYRRRMNPCAQNIELVLFIEEKLKAKQ